MKVNNFLFLLFPKYYIAVQLPYNNNNLSLYLQYSKIATKKQDLKQVKEIAVCGNFLHLLRSLKQAVNPLLQ